MHKIYIFIYLKNIIYIHIYIHIHHTLGYLTHTAIRYTQIYYEKLKFIQTYIDLIDTTTEELTEDDLMKMSASEPLPDVEEADVEETVQENKLTLHNLTDGF